MFSPSGWSLMTSTRAPVAPMIRPATAHAEPFAQSMTIDSPDASIEAGERLPMRDVARETVARVDDDARGCPARRPASSSVRQMSCSSSSSTASSSFSPSASSTFRPLSSAGLCEAETMIPAASSPSAVRNARAGVGTTPTTLTFTPRLVAPAAIAATNMSPDRRVSWPTTIEPPGPTSRCAVARPSANAVVGLRSTLATPRMPSVPNRRGTADRSPRVRLWWLARAPATVPGGSGEVSGMETVTSIGLGLASSEREAGREVRRDRDRVRARRRGR